jgi:hypothetical protein
MYVEKLQNVVGRLYFNYMTQTVPVTATTPPAQTPPPATTQNAAPAEHRGWSWGAFMLGPMFFIGIKRYSYLFMYLLCLIPIANIILFFAIPIYLAKKGRELAYASPMFKSEAEVDGFMKGVDHAGKVSFFVSIIIWAITFVFYIVLWITVISHMPGSNQLNQSRLPGLPTTH